jgi:hypothetical protein
MNQEYYFVAVVSIWLVLVTFLTVNGTTILLRFFNHTVGNIIE